jgi:hypothetical protein
MDYNKTTMLAFYTSGIGAQMRFTFPSAYMVKKIWACPIVASHADFVLTLSGLGGTGVWYTLEVGDAAGGTSTPTPYVVGSIPEEDRLRDANSMVEVRGTGTSGGTYMIGILIAHQE